MTELEEEDRTELFSRRIAEDVSKSVEASLRKRYSWIGMITAFILGGLGYGLITTVLSNVSKSVIRADVMITNVENQLKKADKRTEDKLGEVDQFVEKSSKRLQTFDERIKTIASGAEKQLKKMETLLLARERDLQNLGDTAQRIEDLSTQVAELNKLVAEVASTTEDPGRPDASQEEYAAAFARQTTEIAEIQQQAKQVVQRIKTSRISIFMHVSQAEGFSSEQAEKMVKQLESLGYTVPDTIVVANVRSLNQVRFYHEEDRKAAEQLAFDTAKVLEALGGENPAVEARDFTDWQAAKPRRGVVELWL